ncbi:MAG: hypothetical protein R3E31_04645 [Chloroflexota bacterium]
MRKGATNARSRRFAEPVLFLAADDIPLSMLTEQAAALPDDLATVLRDPITATRR